jgi:hypothetical protein
VKKESARVNLDLQGFGSLYPDRGKTPDPDPHSNLCRSETLVVKKIPRIHLPEKPTKIINLQAVVFKEIVVFLAKTFLLSIIKKFVIVQKVISCKGCRDQCWDF